MIIPEYLRAMVLIGVEKSCFEYSKEGDIVNIIIIAMEEMMICE